MANPSRFDLISLKIFLVAAREGSLTAAAEHIHLTLSAASKRITDLEQATDCILFNRHARGLSLTPAGDALLKHVESLINGLERMANEMEDFAVGVRGHVRVWANASSIIQFLPQSLSIFTRTHPDIKIGLEERLSYDIADAVLSQQADLGILADNVSTKDLEAFTYKTDRLAILVREDHPLADRGSLAFKDVLESDFIGLNQGSSLLERISEAAGREQRALKLRIQVSSFDAICHMVAAGLGISIIPQAVMRHSALGIHLRCLNLQDDWATRRLLVVTRNRSELRPAALRLYEHLLSEATSDTPS